MAEEREVFDIFSAEDNNRILQNLRENDFSSLNRPYVMVMSPTMDDVVKIKSEGESSDSDDSVDYPPDDKTSRYERRILKTKRRLKREFGTFKGELVKASALLPVPPPEKSPVKNEKKRSSKRKRFSTPAISFQPRKSARIAGSGKISYSGLDDDFVEPPTYRRKSLGQRRHSTPRKKIKREVEFDPNISGSIQYKSTRKVYSQSGTTCHQCRQKTADLKSRCYSPYCAGLRGQFCGFCLLKRYGEDVADVLKNPAWKCPPCRRICNCSICRRNFGKAPTGLLYPIASQQGFSSVKEYLAQQGDDRLDDGEDGGEEEENVPPVPKIKEEPLNEDEATPLTNGNLKLKPVVKLERLEIDEADNPYW